MCGIGGIVRLDGAPTDVDGLTILLQRQQHRGPDGQKAWISDDGVAGLVHVRLAIIDVGSRSDQPMVSRDGRFTIVFNGEIYNYLEIRADLRARGVVFHTDGDTEVLLEGWRLWQEDMLPRLNGMFAFAIRDNLSGRIDLVRDRFGVKPLHYAVTKTHFAFASELRALSALPFIEKSTDVNYVERVLFEPLGVEASARTLFRGIQRLEPGHRATLKGGQCRVERWWRTVDNLVTVPTRFEPAAEQFRELFLEAVRLRMRSDVPIGTCLSGGFDSTAVISAMAHIATAQQQDNSKQASDWRHAFIASFPGSAHDETPEALLAADFAAAKAHVINMTDADDFENFDQLMEVGDDILGTLPSAIWRIYQSVRDRGVRVTLDGHGADELIGLYRSTQNSWGHPLRQFLHMGSAGKSPMQGAMTDLLKFFVLRSQNDLYLRKSSPPEPLDVVALRDRLPPEWGASNRRLYGMFHGTILPALLRNFDRLSMAHGVEVRMPFMDWHLVVYSFSLPDSFKNRGGYSKAIAREAMSGLMPNSIRTSKRKVGFSSQMPEWLNAKLGNIAIETLKRRGPGLDEFDEIVNVARLVNRFEKLTFSRSWTWSEVGRLWPYVSVKWNLDRKSLPLKH